MNFFFKAGLSLSALFILAGEARATNLGAFYFASCKRHLGIVLGVDAQTISIATLEGNLVRMPRYRLIYWATYPVDDLPVPLSREISQMPRVKIFTMKQYEKVLLAEGWPVDFTEDKISFLTLAGGTQVIDLDSIWEIRSVSGSFPESNGDKGKARWNFVQPPAFRECVAAAHPDKMPAYAQQILSDPVTIKRELDRLQRGHEKMKLYEERQRFYPVPQIYRNRSYLGLWHMIGARYGRSTHRLNNLTPVLTDQTSKGPFGFQQEIITGAAPILSSVHEETQTHFFYRFKADYFHLSVMLDPTMSLLGADYKWAAADLGAFDDRIIEQAFAEFGFDYGRFSLQLFPAGMPLLAVQGYSRFDVKSMNLPRIGFLYQVRRLKLGGQAGRGTARSFSLDFWRANLGYELNPSFDLGLSLISRRLRYSAAAPSLPTFLYDSESFTVANYLNYYFWKKYYVGSLVSREAVSRQFGLVTMNQRKAEAYWKFGLNLSIGF